MLTALRASWRGCRTEGFIIQRGDTPCRGGPHEGDRWKWQNDPYTVDAVLVQVRMGRGNRAGVHTDDTFAAWESERLVTFARAYSGLTDAEVAALDRWARGHTQSRHGSVRVVDRELVFEVVFGVAVPVCALLTPTQCDT